jgi:hypothetical protein
MFGRDECELMNACQCTTSDSIIQQDSRVHQGIKASKTTAARELNGHTSSKCDTPASGAQQRMYKPLEPGNPWVYSCSRSTF